MAEKKKIDLKKLGETVSDKAKVGIGRARDALTSSADAVVKSLDQTGDGKLGLDDMAELRQQLREKQRQAKLARDLDALNPIFLRDLSEKDFFLPKMIRITEMDKKHAASELCIGSIGHETVVKDYRFVTIYPDQLETWRLRLYPDADQEYYYMDPVDPQHYISINSFFDYLRKARIGELTRIAQELGATYFKVTIREEEKTIHKKSESVKTTGKGGGLTAALRGERSMASNELSAGEIAAETSFVGHAPRKPQLVYYKDEPQIKDLITMRLNPDNTVTGQRLTLKCARSSGITEKDAASIDATFSAMKCSGNTTFTSEAQQEVRQVFEYVIQF